MQQYQVPQFIAVEDRIIGPLTLKQFLYLLGAAAVLVIGWSFFHVAIFAVTALPLAGFLATLAFVKVGGRPLPAVFFAAIVYYVKPRLYLWRKTREQPRAKPEPAKPAPSLLADVQPLSASKLEDLAWSLDIKERIEDRG